MQAQVVSAQDVHPPVGQRLEWRGVTALGTLAPSLLSLHHFVVLPASFFVQPGVAFAGCVELQWTPGSMASIAPVCGPVWRSDCM
jgi:hypothetical protein